LYYAHEQTVNLRKCTGSQSWYWNTYYQYCTYS